MKTEAEEERESGERNALTLMGDFFSDYDIQHVLADAAEFGHRCPDRASGFASVLRKLANAMDPSIDVSARDLLTTYKLAAANTSDELTERTIAFLRTLCAS